MKNKFLYRKCIPYAMAVLSLQEDNLVLVKDKNLEIELNEINKDFIDDEIDFNEFVNQTNECLNHYYLACIS